MSTWKPIDTAPKDRVVLVNDATASSLAPWAAAYWAECGPCASLWVYADDSALEDDATPMRPQPTHWFDVPELQP